MQVGDRSRGQWTGTCSPEMDTDLGATGKTLELRNKVSVTFVLTCRKCYREKEKGAEENKNGGGGGRRDNRGQDRRDSFNKSGHDAFKKKEKVKSLLLRGDM